MSVSKSTLKKKSISKPFKAPLVNEAGEKKKRHSSPGFQETKITHVKKAKKEIIVDEDSVTENISANELPIKDWMGSDVSMDAEDVDSLGEGDEYIANQEDSEEKEEGEEDFSSNPSETEFEEKTVNITNESKKLILNTAVEGLNDDEDKIRGENQGNTDIPNLAQINARIQAAIAILSDWKGHAEQADKSRSSYVQQLKSDLNLYFGYSDFLMDKLMELFPKPSELHSFLEANELERPVTIRCNTLKCKRKELAQSLISRGVNLEPTMEKWNPYGLQVFESRVPIGATPEYLAGHYMLQAAASFLPVLAMGIAPTKENLYEERILDMCAAPGGKTTFIAALMKNQGFLFANDISADRVKALTANIHRMGVTNSVVTCLDARKFGTYLSNFDRILLDAPCSGTGVISKDQTVKISKDLKDIQALTHVQKELILAAIDLLAIGGTLVYSTCSILVEENEEIIDYAIRKRPNMQLVDTSLPFGEEGIMSMRGKQFSKSLKLCRRYYPHTHNLDGFFVARLQKTKK